MTTGLLSGLAYLPDKSPGPGRLTEVRLDVDGFGPSQLVLREAIVRDERPGFLFDGPDLRFEPCLGGGPLVTAERDRQARAFGVVNVAYHAQRALRVVSGLLGHELPRLVLRIGLHEHGRRWGGGHYRVTARQYDPLEPGRVATTGEVHFGGGNGYLPVGDGASYFGAPSHNLAIIYHEIGHHICRHTADFRLNRLRPPGQQTNKKIALDEGTCDLLTAIMLDKPDIYGWHRGELPNTDQRRRRLDPRWTMAHFRGGPTDPHADGTLWASACWSARDGVLSGGVDASRFDRMLLRGMELAAAGSGSELDEQVLRQRRYFSGLLEMMLIADPELTDPVLAAMTAHGIELGVSNAELRVRARARLGVMAGR